MTAISIMIEGQDGLTWPRWKRLAEAVERLGYAGLFRSDHFTNAGPPDKESLELVVSLAYLASSTSRMHFGSLVAPFSFRDPAMLARQAAAIDDLSAGRLILGSARAGTRASTRCSAMRLAISPHVWRACRRGSRWSRGCCAAMSR